MTCNAMVSWYWDNPTLACVVMPGKTSITPIIEQADAGNTNTENATRRRRNRVPAGQSDYLRIVRTLVAITQAAVEAHGDRAHQQASAPRHRDRSVVDDDEAIGDERRQCRQFRAEIFGEPDAMHRLDDAVVELEMAHQRLDHRSAQHVVGIQRDSPHHRQRARVPVSYT